MKDVVFVSPYVKGVVESPSYGLLWMSAYLQEKGYSVAYLEGNLYGSSLEVVEKVEQLDPRIVGISATTLSYPAACFLIRSLKAKNPKVRIGLGGSHATAMQHECLVENPELDYVVAGDGFSAMLQILEGETESHVMVEGKTEDINTLPLPAWDLVNLSQYSGNHPVLRKLSTTTFSSIGCPHRCSFCSLPPYLKRVRFRDPRILVQELMMLAERGVREVFLYDDEFNLSADHALQTCDAIIKSGLNDVLSFKCQMRASARQATPTILRKMRQAGFTVLYWGIESGSQKVLNAIGKDLTVEESEASLKLAHELGFRNYAFLMIQNIEEGWKEAKETREFVKRNKSFLDYHQITIATPYPASELWRRANHEGWLLPNFNLAQLNTYKSVMDTPWMSHYQAEAARLYLEEAFERRQVLRQLRRRLIPLAVRKIIHRWMS